MNENLPKYARISKYFKKILDCLSIMKQLSQHSIPYAIIETKGGRFYVCRKDMTENQYNKLFEKEIGDDKEEEVSNYYEEDIRKYLAGKVKKSR